MSHASVPSVPYVITSVPSVPKRHKVQSAPFNFNHYFRISRRRKSRSRKESSLKRLSTNLSGALSHRNLDVTISEKHFHVSSRSDFSQHSNSSSSGSRATDFDDALANYQSLIRHG